MVTEPIRILIADDQPRARKSLKALLSTWARVGDIHEAGNGLEAVQLVQELQPGVVLLDVRMPEMDGLQATTRIKALGSRFKVIVLSMYPEYRDQALAVGADAFVSKGEAPDRLLEVVSAVMLEGV